MSINQIKKDENIEQPNILNRTNRVGSKTAPTQTDVYYYIY